MVFFVASLVLRLWNGSALTASLEGLDYLEEIIWWDVLIPAAIPAYATIGAVTSSRRPGNRVGWLCLAFGALLAVSEATWEYAARAFEVAPGSLPAGVFSAWIASVINPVMLLPFTLVLLLFPDGRLPSRRWRFVAWAVVAIAGLGMLSVVVGPNVGGGIDTEIANPTRIEGLETVAGVANGISFLALPILLLASVASVFVRWRRAGGGERQQMKWLAYVGAIIVVAVLVGVGPQRVFFFGEGSYLAFLALSVGIAGIAIGTPVAIGIAILRYHLYDIDIIINRTLVYGLLTAMLAMVYVGSVIGLQYGFRAFTGGGSQLAVVASTLVIAALFNPLRRRTQDFIDRRFYRKKYDAQQVLAVFSARLRDETDLDRLNEDLVGVVRGTMQPEHVSLWLRDPKEGR